MNGMLDENGKLVNPEAEMIYLKHQYLDKSWEQLVFGFYFSSDDNSLILPSGNVEYNPYHPHNISKPCVRSFKVKEEYRPEEYRWGNIKRTWFCPDHPFLPAYKSLQELTADY